MLKKFVGIKNVGTFRNSPASGDVEFSKLTLVHAENGRGKTTLCAILRSLQSGNATLIQERKTLNGDDAPHVKVLFDAGLVEFNSGAWSATCGHVEIFDANFVAENVYSGDLITHDHKKNLCRVVLGAEGVRLAKAFDDLDGQVRTLNNALTSTRDAAQKLVPSGITLDQFIDLPIDPDIEKKLAEKGAEIARVKDAAAIKAKPALSTIDLPQPPGNMSATLEKTIEGISADAERLVAQHIEQHRMKGRGEAWLAEGLQYVAADECPFCAQNLQASKLIGVLGIFFSKAYRDFQNELGQFQRAVEHPLSDGALLRVQKVVADNAALVEFWSKYAQHQPPAPLSFDETIQPVIRRLRETLAPLVAQKTSTPLHPVTHSPESLAAIDAWKALRDQVKAYNEQANAFNAAVATVKSNLGAKTVGVLTAELAALEGQKLRHQTSSIATILAFAQANAAKAKAELDKERAREALNKYNEKVIDRYHKTVNDLLERFGTAFTLRKVDVEYTGRTPRVGYTFELRGKEVHPGRDTAPAGTPCFGNTLSSGDRSTLALAFFIAQLKTRPDVKDLIAVFDDPFTSLDAFRQSWTCNQIRAIAGMAKQVIVLSHSLAFLRLLAMRCDKSELKALKIELYNSEDSRIAELDLDDATAALVDKDFIKLRDYCTGDENDGLSAVRAIRPLVENHIRKMAPADCPEGKGWLGDFLREIRESDDTSALAQFKPVYEDIDHLNSYTTHYAHDGDMAPPINEAELRNNGKLALKLIGRPLA